MKKVLRGDANTARWLQQTLPGGGGGTAKI